jgi:phage baseplate assembly protein W
MPTVVTQTVKRYKDLDLNFQAHPVKKDINKHVDEYAVVNSIKNILLTNHYERLFQPQLGSNVSKFLFENMDIITTTVLQKEIEQTITNFEPRVSVKEIIVTPEYDNNRFSVQLTFFMLNRTEPVSIEFFLNRER